MTKENINKRASESIAQRFREVLITDEPNKILHTFCAQLLNMDVPLAQYI